MTANALLGAKAPSLLRRRRPSTPTLPPPGRTGSGTTTQSRSQQHYWRPQILVYLHASESAPEAEVPRKKQLLSFVSQLKATRGLTIAAAVVVEKNLLESIKRRSSFTSMSRLAPLQATTLQQQEQQQQQQQPEQQSLASLLGVEHEKTLCLKKEMMADLAKEGIVVRM